jgi:hypothetical protein
MSRGEQGGGGASSGERRGGGRMLGCRAPHVGRRQARWGRGSSPTVGEAHGRLMGTGAGAGVGTRPDDGYGVRGRKVVTCGSRTLWTLSRRVSTDHCWTAWFTTKERPKQRRLLDGAIHCKGMIGRPKQRRWRGYCHHPARSLALIYRTSPLRTRLILRSIITYYMYIYTLLF